jgi:hypothetical protein
MTVFEASPHVLETAADLIDTYAERSPSSTRRELYKLAEQMREEAREGIERG